MDLSLALSVWPPSSSRQSLPNLVPWLDQSSCTTLEVLSKGSEEYSLDSWTMSTTQGGSLGCHICSGLKKSTNNCNFSKIPMFIKVLGRGCQCSCSCFNAGHPHAVVPVKGVKHHGMDWDVPGAGLHVGYSTNAKKCSKSLSKFF